MQHNVAKVWAALSESSFELLQLLSSVVMYRFVVTC